MATTPSSLDAAIFNAIDGGLVVLDKGQRVTHWNTWMEAASARSAAEVMGKQLGEIFPECRLTRLTSAVTSALTLNASSILTHALTPSILPLQTRAKREMFHDITVSPVGYPTTAACLMFIVDVTLSTKRERYLRDQHNARYDAVAARAPDVIFTVDEEGLIQFANPAAVAQLQYSSAELIGKPAAELFETHDRWQTILRRALEQMDSGQPTHLIACRKDGSRTHLEGSASRWQSGSRVMMTAILRDINERRATEAALRESERQARESAAALAELNQTLEQRVRMRTDQLMDTEEALRQSQKMEAIGNLTGGIAHDFNNLLQVISGNLHLIKREVKGNAFAEQRVASALDGVSRSAKLSSQLLAFARRQPLAPKITDLGKFVREMEDLLSNAVGEGVSVGIAIGLGALNTLIDPGNVENALINLAVNARDAMGGHGQLTILVENVVITAERARDGSKIAAGEYVMISVGDTGAGMSPEVMEKAFEPFFTTKPEGHGTGLGLSMVYGFVKQSGGQVEILSEVGKGTTVNLYLPRSLQPEERRVDIAALPVEGGTETVLLAEDDAAVRETVGVLLQDLGYRVIKAKDAEAALKVIQGGTQVDLLFTDVVMPGPLKSTELARKARAVNPSLAVLFTSGYPEKALMHFDRESDGVELLSKPYSRETLARTLRLVLLRSAAARK
jgi:PAS domain S-box-containing protein